METQTLPTVAELIKMFTKINEDCAAKSENVVPLIDADYYSQQIYNTYGEEEPHISWEQACVLADEMAKEVASVTGAIAAFPRVKLINIPEDAVRRMNHPWEAENVTIIGSSADDTNGVLEGQLLFIPMCDVLEIEQGDHIDELIGKGEHQTKITVRTTEEDEYGVEEYYLIDYVIVPATK